MKKNILTVGIVACLATWLGAGATASAQSLSGNVRNQSTWSNTGFTPPGDGTGAGQIYVGLWSQGSDILGPPGLSAGLTSTPTLPFALDSYHAFTLAATSGTYSLSAWVDGNANAAHDPGEPFSPPQNIDLSSNNVVGLTVTIVDDSDNDGIDDWWEVYWFKDLETSVGNSDFDNDGLTDLEEFEISRNTSFSPPLTLLSPNNWDSDGDLMDDGWEYRHYAFGTGTDPITPDAQSDADGDGLTNLQEYNGVDGIPPRRKNPASSGQIALITGSTDDINPIDVDTDNDTLIDSFEATWYDTASGIDPRSVGNPAADPDLDGLSNYREMCLLGALRQNGVHDLWTLGAASLPLVDFNGLRAFTPPLTLNASNATIWASIVALRANIWTDPTEGSSYVETPQPGHDTDGDELPDGWELEFNLDPKSGDPTTNGFVNANGFWGDADQDALINWEEYLGQDGNRSGSLPFINGTGDETSPNTHNWRPMSTASGPGTSRPFITSNWWLNAAASPSFGTLGAALPTLSLGSDPGLDSDDDGLPDSDEIWAAYLGLGRASSPVHSTDPFIHRAILLTSAAGISIPDPEGTTHGYSPLLHRRDWTVECQVKLMATNCTGNLINHVWPTLGGASIVYRLWLTNNAPIISFHRVGGSVPLYSATGLPLPTNQWIHLAGVWNYASNSLSLYVDGIFVQQVTIFQEALSSRTFSTPTPILLGASAGGSFVNKVYMDEIRIWGSPRSAADLETYRTRLVSPSAPDLLAYYRFDDGGTSAEDFARKAKSGLLSTASEDYTFGDFGYALATNNFLFVTNTFAPTRGVDDFGSDDSDGDGLPDAWEVIHHFNFHSATGRDGAQGDPDDDHLWNIYEYWAQTNPNGEDSDDDGVLDGNEDYDGDGVANITEQDLGSRPDLIDTDDDGSPDNIEQGASTDPVNPIDPNISRALVLGGGSGDFLSIPQSFSQRLRSWTLEAWVNPTNVTDGDGIIARRTVQSIGGGQYAMTFVLGLETNGATLRPYAGYVLSSGAAYILRGGSLPAGEWTHLAATYNNQTATLILYTNATALAMTNGFAIDPPVNGKGGETFVRIGEGFAGQLDEVRIWNTARSAAELATYYRQLFDTLPSGLIHYFRFDDGQATTNVFPFGVFHQPHGAQDFVYSADWSNNWVHAGRFNGAVDFVVPGAFVPPPSLRILIQPEQARLDGAQWTLDGGEWRNSGVTLQNIIEGTHQISYNSILNWSSPTNESIALSNGMAVTLTRTYLQNGSLRVILAPADAVTAGAQWRIDGGVWLDGGETISNVSVGVHSLDFKPATGWDAPSSETVTMPEGGSLTLTRTYVPAVADLSIILEPAAARTAGARWSIDGGPWLTSGTTNTVSAGDHAIAYQGIPLWISPSNETLTLVSGLPVSLTRNYLPNIILDSDGDGLLDSWELNAFGNLTQSGAEDYDQDGLSNLQEHNLYYSGMTQLSPTRFDSDNDGMDDKWEYDHMANGTGLLPDVADGLEDADGDGLVNRLEYIGLDNKPRLKQDPEKATGIAIDNASTDSLDPLNFDTDKDGLLDSFEVAWYDPAHAIDPLSADAFDAEQDEDGLTAFREQCLLDTLGENGDNDLWSLGTNAFPSVDGNGLRALDFPLQLGATNSPYIAAQTVFDLRSHAWTDPTHGSGYEFDYPLDGSDGWDTDGDLLPDGWELEFNLDPRSGAALIWDGSNWVINADGFWGDPDGDGLLNTEEYYGQDDRRSLDKPYINGTGDETNPNEHNWRPDSTGTGPGTKRPFVPYYYWDTVASSPSNGTLGAARPTLSFGADSGTDTDDDGIPDDVEIRSEYLGLADPSSPVHSLSPFIRRAARIVSTNGIVLPDPEGSPLRGYSPLLHRDAWTIECYVKLDGTNCTGWLIDNPGPLPSQITYRLALSNNVPSVTFDTVGGFRYVQTGSMIPSNRWTHIAAVWNPAQNTLSLYINGVFDAGQRIFEPGVCSRLFASSSPVTLAKAPNGSFVNRVALDEVRIWGVARSAAEIEAYRRHLAPPEAAGLRAYFRFDDGGLTAEDFVRKAKTGLLGASSENYTFGDSGYALPTNGFRFITNTVADVLGVDARNADDSDGDGLPDPWEMLNGFDPHNATGVDGAEGDRDSDGLNNLYEYWSETNPNFEDTDTDGILDIQEDRDGDGLDNVGEQDLNSRPDWVDTDDDGLDDGEEWLAGSALDDPLDPLFQRSVWLAGSAEDYLEVPVGLGQRLTSWTLEAWVNPSNNAGGLIVGRALQRQPDGSLAMNFILGLRTSGAQVQPFAGYLTADGTTNYLYGLPFPVGEWRHLAATYDKASSSLILYTNGYVSVTTNTFFASPLLNGQVGESWVRIGQGFRGLIDEVRIWSEARTSVDIRSNTHRAIDETAVSLRHYFRFDDGQSVSNRIAFGPYHQPFGAQDFKFRQDWTNQWIHAAQLHGQVAFVAAGAFVLPPSLRVVLQPDQVRLDGAQWAIDGGAWQDSGTKIVNLSIGSHTITYKAMPGWTTPATEVIDLTNNMATTLVRTYLVNGSLQINITPPAAVTDGAQWRIDGGSWQNSGVILSNIAVGDHLLDFKSLLGWDSPPSETISLPEGGALALTRTYSVSTAQVSVVIEPAVARTAGARWNIDGGPWLESGITNVISSGSHVIGYLPIPLWSAPTNETIVVLSGSPISLTRYYLLNAVLDEDGDGLLDSWELTWFGNLEATPDEDYDNDGLPNKQEHQLFFESNMLGLDPTKYDSDGDGMDDKWEYDHYADGTGLLPDVADGLDDADGDGLVNRHEYLGLDNKPRLKQNPEKAAGIAIDNASADSLNPLNFDTDNDGLLDSFEVAWYDPTHDITPYVAGNLAADQDEDGLTVFREQCLLDSLGEDGDNDLWSLGTNALPAVDGNGLRALDFPLQLGATNSTSIDEQTVYDLRNHAWTDPTHGSGHEFDYPLDGSDGWDTDSDLLPDGWELEFNLDPRSGDAVLWDGSNWVINADGFWGDPDGDGLLNTEEYYGQDDRRSLDKPYINGTGDETNPNEHNWRPDSTGTGPGTKRPWVPAHYWSSFASSPSNGTLGAARPTLSFGADFGADTDDDGIPDDVEIRSEYLGLADPSSPVHSLSPFVRRAARIVSTNGIVLPDPEGSPLRGYSPLLHREAWTIECYVKLDGTNCTGWLIDNPGPLPSQITYRLALSNNVPSVTFDTVGGFRYVQTGSMIPSNRWTHIAAVWNPAQNTLSLYINGVFDAGQRIFEPGVCSRLFASSSPVTLAKAPNGSFVNRVALDEVRIWGVARSAAEIEAYRRHLAPPEAAGLRAYFRFDDGGLTAEDFVRKAKTGLLGASSEDYTFGDLGYALPTNGFRFITNTVADVLGVDARNADDSDGDGLPDPWEMLNEFDPHNATGVDGAEGDRDSDGLNNLYEYWSETNPNFEDTDTDGILDIQEDRDGDGLSNQSEQTLGTRPDWVDTDDDGLTDYVESTNGTNPADAHDPGISRAVWFGGSPDDFLDIPVGLNQRLTTWTLEAWVNPSNNAGGLIVGRALQRLSDGGTAMNYHLGLRTSGALVQPFAGYHTASGKTNYLYGTPFAIGQWTHLAAVYSPVSGTMTLYTNGAQDAFTNSFGDLPMLNGQVGDSWVRIGQGFHGLIDEIRIWAGTRTSGDIQANLNRTLDPAAADLRQYFRFDDTQSNTNRFPFGKFNQPFGAQDTKFRKDWTNQWIHAAFLRANVRFTADGTGAIIPPPGLRINLLPLAAIAAGAQWAIDGGTWNDSGQTVDSLTPGPHSITYLPINGWTAPTNETVILTNGVTTALTRNYVENGRLTVTLQPSAALPQGALWRVDGGPWLASGVTASNLSVGLHVVNFQTATNWIEPAPQTVTINEGAETTLIAIYVPITGAIQVYLVPAPAITLGAAWRVDSGAWQGSGNAVSNLALGSHSVEFRDAAPYLSPASFAFTVTNGATFVRTGVYTMVSGIYVTINPSDAVASGAQWRVSGGAWTNSGSFVQLSPGSYTVDFKPVLGWAEPPPIATVVSNEITTFLNGTYYQYAVLGTYGTNLSGQFNKPTSVAYDKAYRLYVADSLNDRLQIYHPTSRVWTILGTPGTNVGQFDHPVALAFDAADNLYVADANNDRIQRWNRQSNTWSQIGGPGSGTGQFNGPFDIAIDAATNLYVADIYNNRVQRRAPNGAWSIFVTNGFALNQTRSPRGLAINTNGEIILGDYDTSTSISRIRRFAATGTYIDRIGSSATNEGGFLRSWGMSVSAAGALAVADYDNSQVKIGSTFPSGWSLLVGASVLKLPQDVAFDPHGFLCIADTGNNRILLLTLPTSQFAPANLDAMSTVKTPSGFVISWMGEAGWIYTIQYTDSLNEPIVWTDVPGGANLIGTNGPMSCLDTTSVGVLARYYRILAY